jgi:predicted Zn-dependent protease
MTTRLESFRAMVAKNPDNLLAHYGLANEAAKEGLHEEAIEHYAVYLTRYDDEGNGWQRYAESLATVDRADAARDALHRGIEASRRFGHSGMAAELEERLEELGPA